MIKFHRYQNRKYHPILCILLSNLNAFRFLPSTNLIIILSYPTIFQFCRHSVGGIFGRRSEGHHVSCTSCCNDTTTCNIGLKCENDHHGTGKRQSVFTYLFVLKYVFDVYINNSDIQPIHMLLSLPRCMFSLLNARHECAR